MEAKMINAERKKRQDEDGPTYYEVHVDVTYEVDGHSYSGKVVKSSGKKESRKLKRQINKEGGTTTIFYDPDDPSRYIQVRGVTPASFLIFLLPALFFITGGVFLGGRF
ncbi:DUF3592 domain-containing protein [Candidatus Bathyarchaeota archaeon]|nr:DUF3592 domain-containing protein [Candidatus Bathyarchaeota archaeon]